MTLDQRLSSRPVSRTNSVKSSTPNLPLCLPLSRLKNSCQSFRNDHDLQEDDAPNWKRKRGSLKLAIKTGIAAYYINNVNFKSDNFSMYHKATSINQ
jgi:hypothetical protein